MSRRGFFTDTSVCIGCKACEVACKQWNQLPDDGFRLSGHSYDNTVALGASTWRHVAFIERPRTATPMPGASAHNQPFEWLFSSDVCKHCVRAGCLEVCPTGAITRTEFDTVYVQPDICNGCGYCVVGCPFGVIERNDDDGRAWKCTLCYDRLKGDLEPACAKACPTDSIVFGDVVDLQALARERLSTLRARGAREAQLYGIDEGSQPGTRGLNAFFLLQERPEAYNLPPDPVVPTEHGKIAWRSAAAAMIALGVGLVFAVAGERR